MRYPARFYARHIKEGLVHYNEKGTDKLYLVTNEALQKMNKSFEGKPVYIRHVEEVDLDKMKEESVGRVVKSFYNEFDGAWWLEMVLDDEAIGAVEKGWAVSNAYLPTEYGAGGVYHDITYDKEVKDGVYEHLAIVDNPRYEEAVIMTPDEFKDYNEGRKTELDKLKNSKENEMTDEEKSALVESIKNSLAETINDAVKNAVEEKMEEAKKNAEDEDHRKLIREIAAVSAKEESDFEGGMDEKIREIIKLAEKLGYSKDEAKDNSSDEEEKSNESDEEKDNSEDEEEKENACSNEDEESKDNKCNEEDEEKKENSKSFFDMFKNAKANKASKVVMTERASLELGNKRYGSK